MIYVDQSNAEQISQDFEADGFPFGAIPRDDHPDGRLEGMPIFGEQIELLPESQWLDTARATYERGGFIGQRVQLDANADAQGRNPTCWSKSLAQVCMYARGALGMPFVQLAGESLIPVTGGRVQGYYLDRALAWLMENGIASAEFVGGQNDYNMRHFKPGIEENRRLYVPLEGFDGGRDDPFAVTVTALCAGWPCYVASNKMRHAMCADGLVIEGNKLLPHCVNTWGPGRDLAIDHIDEVYVLRSFTYVE
jgi:hypothetical protein